MPEEDLHFGRLAVRASVVTGASQAIKVGIQFISVVLLARLLEPADFGLVAAVGPLVAFVSMFQDLGLQQAIVQRKDITETHLNQIFWLMVWVGLGCAAIVASISPAVAWFYNDPRLVHITILAACPLLIGSATSLPISLLNRRLQFGTLAIIDVANSVIALLVAAISALYGMGYYSLLIASIVATASSFIGAWMASKWRPGPPRRDIDREILKFGAHLTGFNFLNFFARNLDNILIGRYAGSTALGYYDRAYKLMMFPLQNVVGPLARVMVPLLSRIQDDKAHLREMYIRTASLLTLAAVPGVAALTIVPQETIRFLFGEKWMPVVPIFTWLGLAGMVQPLNSSMGWLFISQGRTGTMLKWGIFSCCTTLASFIIGLPWGAVGVAAAYAISDVLIRLPAVYVVMGRMGPVKVSDFIKIQFPLLAAAGLTWLSMAGLKQVFALHDILLIACCVGLSYFYAVLALACHSQGRYTLGQLRDNAFKIYAKVTHS